MNEIIPLENPNPVVLFTQGGLDNVIERIESEARSLVPDLTTAKGRKEIASVAARVARSKTYLDEIGKDYVAELKKSSNAVDAVRRDMRERLDALKDEVRSPLTEWEKAEQERIDAIKRRIDDIKCFPDSSSDSHVLREYLDRVRLIDAENEEWFQELKSEAMTAKAAAIESLLDRIKQAEEREELERLRAEQARVRQEQDRIERERRIADEAAERARKEEQAKADREAKEIALQAIRQQQEAEARHKSELDAERRRAAEAMAKTKAAERDREEKEAEDRRRAADEKHRNDVHAEIVSDLELIGFESSDALRLVNEIASGFIHRLSILY